METSQKTGGFRPVDVGVKCISEEVRDIKSAKTTDLLQHIDIHGMGMHGMYLSSYLKNSPVYVSKNTSPLWVWTFN